MKNLILITIDCLRQDFLDLGRDFKFDTFQKLFDEGIYFANMISAGTNTAMAFSSILCSSYPSMYGGYGRLSKRRITIADALKNHGYVTAGVHSNPNLISQYNYDRGFQYYYDYTKIKRSKLAQFVCGFRKRYKKRFEHNQTIKNLIDWLSDNNLLNYFVLKHILIKNVYDDAKTINLKAIEWLTNNKNKSDNFFLWLHYMDLHEPYLIHSEVRKLYDNNINQTTATKILLKAKKNRENITDFEAEQLKLLYLCQIKYLDFRLIEFLRFLSRKGFLENTIIILTADHGEEFFEHRLYGHAQISHEKRDLYLFNTVLHIPFLIYGAGIEAGENKILTSTVDIAPTICALLDVERPKEWLGDNMLSKDFDRKVAISEQVYLEEGKISGAYAFQTRDEKFIFNTYDRSYQYYRLDEDPCETRNRIDAYPEKTAQIDQLNTAHQKMVLETQEATLEHPEIDQETARRLRNLGYM